MALTDAEQRQLRVFLKELREQLGTVDPTDDPATDHSSATGAAQRIARVVLDAEAGKFTEPDIEPTDGITRDDADVRYVRKGEPVTVAPV